MPHPKPVDQHCSNPTPAQTIRHPLVQPISSLGPTQRPPHAPAQFRLKKGIISNIFNSSSFALNICIRRSGLFYISIFNCILALIFGQFGLHVIVRKRYGFPKRWTKAIASMYLLHISLGLPMNDASNTIRWPICSLAFRRHEHCLLCLDIIQHGFHVIWYKDNLILMFQV